MAREHAAVGRPWRWQGGCSWAGHAPARRRWPPRTLPDPPRRLPPRLTPMLRARARSLRPRPTVTRHSNGTSMISLILPPKDQISRASKMLADEYGTASNIKSRVNRLSVLSAITSTQQRLKLFTKVRATHRQTDGQTPRHAPCGVQPGHATDSPTAGRARGRAGRVHARRRAGRPCAGRRARRRPPRRAWRSARRRPRPRWCE